MINKAYHKLIIFAQHFHQTRKKRGRFFWINSDCLPRINHRPRAGFFD